MSKRRTVGEELRALAVECGGRAGATPDDEAATLWRTASVEYAEAAKHLARYQDLERQVASIKMEYGAARRRAERAHNHAEARDARRGTGGGKRRAAGSIADAVRKLTR